MSLRRHSAAHNRNRVCPVALLENAVKAVGHDFVPGEAAAAGKPKRISKPNASYSRWSCPRAVASCLRFALRAGRAPRLVLAGGVRQSHRGRAGRRPRRGLGRTRSVWGRSRIRRRRILHWRSRGSGGGGRRTGLPPVAVSSKHGGLVPALRASRCGRPAPRQACACGARGGPGLGAVLPRKLEAAEGCPGGRSLDRYSAPAQHV